MNNMYILARAPGGQMRMFFIDSPQAHTGAIVEQPLKSGPAYCILAKSY
jgi:hypothetical protein